MIFSLIASLLGCCVTLFLFVRYVWFSGVSAGWSLLAFAVFVALGCTPLMADYRVEKYLGAFYPAWRHGLHALLVACVFWFCLTLICDVFYFSGLGLGWFRPVPVVFYGSVLAAISLACAGWALFEGLKVPAVQTVTLYSDKITQARTLVVLSDLHIHRALSADKLARIVAVTNQLNPDAVLLVGDVLDDDVARVQKMTRLLGDLTARNGVFFVTGNHEFYAGYGQTVAALKALGFTFLENAGASLGDVFLGGIPDQTAGRFYRTKIDLEAAFAEAREDQYKILLSHTPIDFQNRTNFDLEVSGHTHGGQIFPFTVLTKLYNKFLAGLYDLPGGARLYVTRGAGQWGPQMRFLAPAEITLLKLLPTSAGK